MSVSSFKGCPRWSLTLICRVVAPASTLFCSFSMIALRTSVSGDLERFSFDPHPIHLWITWKDSSLSVKYKRSIWSSCVSKHSLRDTSSGRLELRSSSSLPAFLDSRIHCSCRSACVSGAVVFHYMTLKLPKTLPIDLVGGFQEPSPTVHDPSKPKTPRSPDSVPNQYNFSLCSKSTVYASFPTLCCDTNRVSVSDS